MQSNLQHGRRTVAMLVAAPTSCSTVHTPTAHGSSFIIHGTARIIFAFRFPFFRYRFQLILFIYYNKKMNALAVTISPWPLPFLALALHHFSFHVCCMLNADLRRGGGESLQRCSCFVLIRFTFMFIYVTC